MQEELKCLHENNKWDLVEWMKEINILNINKVYKIKHEGKENKQR